MKLAAVLNALKASTLRGMGGAGFPTGSKWEIVRNASGTQKYVVCNADESEPGTIKDRFIMENVPHLVIEGMIMAGLVTRNLCQSRWLHLRRGKRPARSDGR